MMQGFIIAKNLNLSEGQYSHISLKNVKNYT